MFDKLSRLLGAPAALRVGPPPGPEQALDGEVVALGAAGAALIRAGPLLRLHQHLRHFVTQER